MDDLQAIVRKLHKINFGKGGIIPMDFGCDDDILYSEKFLEKETPTSNVLHFKKTACEGWCDNCKKICPEFRPSSITHGVHTFDFFDAHKVNRSEAEKWSKKPVLFVMENPANVDPEYFYLSEDENRPATPKRWYWITYQSDTPNEKFVYPEYFEKKGEYGWLVYSAIRTFKIANAYITNMVKCGMRKDGKYLTTEDYDEKITENCIKTRLIEEIEALKGNCSDVIIFAFGNRVYDKLFSVLCAENKNLRLYKLPHPARRLLQNSFRKFTLFGQIYEALISNDFYGENQKPDIDELFKAAAEKNI